MVHDKQQAEAVLSGQMISVHIAHRTLQLFRSLAVSFAGVQAARVVCPDRAAASQPAQSTRTCSRTCPEGGAELTVRKTSQKLRVSKLPTCTMMQMYSRSW